MVPRNRSSNHGASFHAHGANSVPMICARTPTRRSSDCPRSRPFPCGTCPSGGNGIHPPPARPAFSRDKGVTAHLPYSLPETLPGFPDVPGAILWTPQGGSGRQSFLEILRSPGDRERCRFVPREPILCCKLDDADRVRRIEQDRGYSPLQTLTPEGCSYGPIREARQHPGVGLPSLPKLGFLFLKLQLLERHRLPRSDGPDPDLRGDVPDQGFRLALGLVIEGERKGLPRDRVSRPVGLHHRKTARPLIHSEHSSSSVRVAVPGLGLRGGMELPPLFLPNEPVADRDPL
jgi:hypothetical protein